MKTYRIYHNPYLRETKVHERFEGDAKEWGVIGGENSPSLNKILTSNKTIQEIGLDLLKAIQEHNTKRNSSREYIIEYIGTCEDFEDFNTITENFIGKNDVSELKEVVSAGVFDDSLKLLSVLESSWRDIYNMYKDGSSELRTKLENCKEMEDSGLTVLVYGLQNAGKSTLINALLEKEVLPASDDVETAALCEVKYGNEYKVIIETLDHSDTTISFPEGQPISYKSEIDWLCRALDKFIEDEKADISSTPEERIYKLITLLNKECRDIQGSEKQVATLRIQIELPSYNIGSNGNDITIIDCPGSNAVYLNDEHKILIDNAIKSAKHAVSIYAMPYLGINWETTDGILEKIKEADLSRANDEGGQIDFDRSVYVLTQVDGRKTPALEGWVERNPKYKEKRVVPVSAITVIEMLKMGLDELSYSYNFVGEDNKNGRALHLEQKAVYPSSYKPEEIWADYINKAEDIEKASVKLRTGVPIVKFFLEDYALRFATIYRVECYYKALNKALEVLREEQNVKKGDLQNVVSAAAREKEDIRRSLKDKCDETLQREIAILDNDNSIERDYRDVSFVDIHTNICDVLSEKKNILTNQFPVLLSEADKEIKKLKVAKQKVPEDFKIAHVVNYTNKTIDGMNEYFVNIAKNEVDKQVNKFKILLKSTISDGRPHQVENIELQKIYDEIDAWNPDGIKKDKFNMKKADFAFKHTSGFGDKLKYLFSNKKWVKERVDNLFSMYWSKQITDVLMDQIIEGLKEQFEELNDKVKDELDRFAPTLIDAQKKIDKAANELDILSKKIEVSQIICDNCSKVVSGGKVNV